MSTVLPPAAQLHDARSPATPSYTPGGLFPSADVHAALMALYNAKLALWPVPYEEFDVPTRYGRTHIVAAGNPAAPPLLMLHQGSTPSFTWQPIIAPLAARYRTYAVDTIGDIGKSVLDDLSQYPRNGEQLAGWLCEVADACQIEQSDVVGGSYGSWLAVYYATRAPARVRRLVLEVPMALPTWPQTLVIIARLMSMAIGASSPAKMERNLSYMMGDKPAVRELFADWFTTLIRARCKLRIAQPFPIPSHRLRAIEAPTLVILGGQDRLLSNEQQLARRAVRLIRQVEVDVVPNGTHALHAGEAEHVIERMLKFLEPIA